MNDTERWAIRAETYELEARVCAASGRLNTYMVRDMDSGRRLLVGAGSGELAQERAILLWEYVGAVHGTLHVSRIGHLDLA